MLNKRNYRDAYVYAVTGKAPESLTIAVMEELNRIYETVADVADLWLPPRVSSFPKPLSWLRFLLWGIRTSPQA